jgi:hypothetical protein
MNEFLNPKSMVTPGAAGAMTMMIANTIAINFGYQPAYFGLPLSFVFGLLVFMTKEIKGWQRFIYYFINSLIIFSIGFGGGNIGANLSHPDMSQKRLDLAMLDKGDINSPENKKEIAKLVNEIFMNHKQTRFFKEWSLR